MNLPEATERMNKTVDQLRESLVGVRSGMWYGVLDTVKVPCYGQPTPIKHIATTNREKNGISIQPHDPSMVGTIANVLSKQGFNAYVFSKTSVMVSVEPPSGEQKKEIIAHVSKLSEEAKVAIRNLRKKCRQDLEGTKDEIKDAEKQLQNLTDQAIGFIDEIANKKIKEL